MALAMIEREPMAKKRGRPPGDRNDTTVKVDRKLAAMARIIAANKGIKIGEYLSGLIEGPIRRDYLKIMRDMEPRE